MPSSGPLKNEPHSGIVFRPGTNDRSDHAGMLHMASSLPVPLSSALLIKFIPTPVSLWASFSVTMATARTSTNDAAPYSSSTNQ